MQKYNAADNLSLVAAIGTIATETASTFMPVREAWFIYDPNDPVNAERLYQANPAPAFKWYNDTSKHAPYSGGGNYHGRGWNQLTHDYNYQAVQDKSGIPVVANPDLVLQDINACAEAFGIFWTAHGMTAIAQRRDWAGIRRVLYGGSDPVGAQRIQNIAASLGV